MNRNSRTILRYASRAIVLAAILHAPATARAGFVGVLVTKSCPAAPVTSGTTFQCTFSVQNTDPNHGVNTLVVTNTVPCSDPPTCTGGVTTTVPCNQGGVEVTALAPLGFAADTCTGAVEETAPFCSGTDIFFTDQIVVTGIIEIPDAPIPFSNSVVNGVMVNCCPEGTDPIVCVITRLLRNIVLIKGEIILLPGELFPAPGNRQALLSQLDIVERKVEDQKFDDAGKALNDLLKHLDGCASADGTPDSNDWITGCAEQTRIRSLIDALIADIGEI
jgi:hypothetical protein